MKTIGLIGGMSWESSLEYYRKINQRIASEMGGLNSAKCLMYSVNFNEMESFQRTGQWDKAANMLQDIANDLEVAGADCMLICTNTMHKVADRVQQSIHIPLIHIGDATAEAINRDHITKIGLLGTRYTMEENFYQEKLIKRGIEVLTPDATGRSELNQIIFNELCQGKFLDASKRKIVMMIEKLRTRGAEAIVLGCTEIPLIIKQEDSSLPIYNTLDIHVEKAVEFSLRNLDS